MITITTKVYTQGTFMHVVTNCRRRRDANNREDRMVARLREAIRVTMQTTMMAYQNGVLVSGKNKKLNDALIKRFQAERKKGRNQ